MKANTMSASLSLTDKLKYVKESVYIYFMTDDTAKTNATGSSFTGGTLALTGGAGLAVGALATALGMKTGRKKEKSVS